jgi:hypothetical protein
MSYPDKESLQLVDNSPRCATLSEAALARDKVFLPAAMVTMTKEQ